MIPASRHAHGASNIPRVRRTSSYSPWGCSFLGGCLEVLQYLLQDGETRLKRGSSTVSVHSLECLPRKKLPVGALDDGGNLLEFALHPLRRGHELRDD